MNAALLTVQQLSVMDKETFVQTLGGVFEHSPWVAESTWADRPFLTVAELHATMLAVVMRAGLEAQLELIRAHPQLAGKEAQQNTLTAESHIEQNSAGLHCCSPDELTRLHLGNLAYLERFGFPFIMAVKGRTRLEILLAMDRRLRGKREEEFAKCLEEIGKIADFRLKKLFFAK